MYTPFLDIVDPNEDVSNLDYSGNYSDDLPNIGRILSDNYI